jgi:hypothetical protein
MVVSILSAAIAGYLACSFIAGSMFVALSGGVFAGVIGTFLIFVSNNRHVVHNSYVQQL